MRIFYKKKDMGLVYQQEVIEASNEIVNILRESDFFIENEVSDDEPALNFFCDLLTEKFIIGELEKPYFTGKEMEENLKLLIAECHLRHLQKLGLLESYGDENLEEKFFLTKKGKELGDKLFGSSR